MPDLDEFQKAYQRAKAANAARGIDSSQGLSRSWRPLNAQPLTRGYHSEVPVMRKRQTQQEAQQEAKAEQSSTSKKVEPAPPKSVEPAPILKPTPVEVTPPQPSYSTASITFEYDSAIILPAGRQVLDFKLIPAFNMVRRQVVTLSSNMPTPATVEFIVVGHTDARGADGYNNSLSQRRAQAVCDYIRARGYAGRLECIGMGESQLADPLNPNSGVNRRVEIITKTIPAAVGELL